MSRRVLVTRSRPGAERTAERLSALGYEPVLTPMLTIEDRPVDPAAAAGVQAVLVTSAHAARRLSALAGPLPRVLAVGGRTGEVARAAGAGDVASADGDVDALVALARETLRPDAGPLLHLRGADTAGDAAGALRAAGFTVEEAIAYAAAPAEALAPDAVAALRAGEVGAALFHSARGGAAFMAAVRRADLQPLLEPCAAVSLSLQAGAPAADAPFRRRETAQQPDEEGLFDALARALNPKR